MSHKTRSDISFHHAESHKIQLLEQIQTNTNSINVNVDTLEVNTDGLETLITATNDKLDSYSGHPNNSIAIGDGSTQLRVLPLGYNQSAGQVRSLLCDASGHQQIDVISSALPSGGATEAKQDVQETTLNSIQTAVEIIDNAIQGNEMQCDIITSALPSGASTATLQGGGLPSALSTDNLKVSLKESIAVGVTNTTLTNLNNCIDSNELQVDIVASALPSGAATQSTLNDAEVHLGSIDGKITACNTGAVTVSASALPSGAATQSTLNDAEVHLGSIDGKITACNTGAVTVSASALPSGAATQSTLNDAEVHLGSIDGKMTQGYDLQIASGGSGLQQNLIYGRDNSGNLDALKTDASGHLEVVVDDFVKGQAAMVASFPVTIASNQSNLNVNANISGTVVDSNSGNKSAQTQRVVIADDDTNLSAIKSSLDNIDNSVDGNYLNINANIAGTDVDSNSGNKSAATQRVVVATDDVNLSAIKSSLDSIDNAVDGNYLNINANIAGTDVDSNSGNKSAATQRVVVATDDVNLSAVKTATELVATAIGTDGSAGPANCISIGATASLGGAIQEVACDADGHLQIDILSSALPSGAATDLPLQAVAAKTTLATSAEIKELLSNVTVNQATLSAELDTEHYEKIRLFGETSASVGSDIKIFGSNTSGGTYYYLNNGDLMATSLSVSGLGTAHYIGGSFENIPRYIKIFNNSGSTNHTFTKLYMVGSGGREAV